MNYRASHAAVSRGRRACVVSPRRALVHKAASAGNGLCVGSVLTWTFQPDLKSGIQFIMWAEYRWERPVDKNNDHHYHQSY